jgi:hypothetical protein
VAAEHFQQLFCRVFLNPLVTKRQKTRLKIMTEINEGEKKKTEENKNMFLY